MKRILSQYLLKKYQPTLILVAGTWGKSMTIHLLSKVLTELGTKNASAQTDQLEKIASSFDGATLFGLCKSVLKEEFYPKVIFAELHDPVIKSRDLLDLAQNKIFIIPCITQSEVQAYGSLGKYLQKKCLLTKAFAKDLTIVYNKDIPGLEEAVEALGAKKTLSVSARSGQADYTGFNLEFTIPEDAHLTNDHRIQGIQFKAKNGGATLPLKLHEAGGEAHMYPVLFAMVLSGTLGMNQVDLLPIIRKFKILPGRMKFLSGIKKTLLLDDTYDADAETAYQTFKVGSEIELQKDAHRIAVLSDLTRHGHDSEQAHCLLGDELAGLNYDAVVAVGERCSDLLGCAKDAGMQDHQLYHFDDAMQAGKFIQHELKQGDLVVVKGSKDFQLESIIKELMAFPLEAKAEILMR